MIRPLPQGRTYTIAVYIGSLVFVLALIVLAVGVMNEAVPEAVTAMATAFAALGAVAAGYSAKAATQHYRGLPKPDPEPMVREELP